MVYNINLEESETPSSQRCQGPDVLNQLVSRPQLKSGPLTLLGCRNPIQNPYTPQNYLDPPLDAMFHNLHIYLDRSGNLVNLPQGKSSSYWAFLRSTVPCHVEVHEEGSDLYRRSEVYTWPGVRESRWGDLTSVRAFSSWPGIAVPTMTKIRSDKQKLTVLQEVNPIGWGIHNELGHGTLP